MFKNSKCYYEYMESKNIESNNENLTKKERKKLRLKNIILDGASELFLNSDFEDVTMSDIADSVALSRATLYNYFGSKEEIFYEIGSRYTREQIIKLKKLHDSEKSGLESFLSFYKLAYEDLLKIPLIPMIFENLIQTLIKINLLQSFINISILEDSSIEIEAMFESLNKHVRDFATLYIEFRRILNAEYRRGKIDGSIQPNLDEIKVFGLTSILYLGSGSFFRNFQILFNNKWMNGNEIIELILKIIESQLTGST